MKAVRPHGYDKRPAVEDVPEPEASGSFDVLVEIGGAGAHTAKYPPAAVNDAMDDLDNGHLQGRGVLVPERS